MDIQHIAAPEAVKDYPRNWSAFWVALAAKRRVGPIWNGCAGRKDLSARAAAWHSIHFDAADEFGRDPEQLNNPQ